MYSTEKLNEVIVIKFENENRITAVNSEEFQETLISAIDNTHHTVVDFKGIEYIDSTALNTLILALEKAKSLDKKLFLCEISGKLKELLKITKLNQVFNIYENREIAIQAVDKL